MPQGAMHTGLFPYQILNTSFKIQVGSKKGGKGRPDKPAKLGGTTGVAWAWCVCVKEVAGVETRGSQEKPITGLGQYAGPSEHSPLQLLEKAPNPPSPGIDVQSSP